MEENSIKDIEGPNTGVFILEEHGTFKKEHLDYIRSLSIDFVETEYEGEPKFLGIKPDLHASYYIGADWLTEKEAVIVTPKMADIDFIEMFVTALKNVPSAGYFSKFYGIDLKKPKIKIDESLDQLTPLLLLHYIFTLKHLLERGLKRDYIYIDENLKSKIKGKILISNHIENNIMVERRDRTFCRYQDYSFDIPVNRLLKKALLFANRFLISFASIDQHEKLSNFKNVINKLLKKFNDISEQIDINQVKYVKANGIFRDYGKAIELAKMILRRYDYSIENVGKMKEIPPFWIDMSRLYEVYVYSLLLKAYPKQIEFQVNGYWKTAVDFIKLDEKVIIDTKYKPHYKDGNSGIIDDIRQLSAYARDKRILGKLKCGDDFIPPCLIIYPEKEYCDIDGDGLDFECREVLSFSENNVLNNVSQIRGVVKFYKVCVPLPVKNDLKI